MGKYNSTNGAAAAPRPHRAAKRKQRGWGSALTATLLYLARARNPIRQRDIAKAARVPRGSVGTALPRLLEKGYIERVDPAWPTTYQATAAGRLYAEELSTRDDGTASYEAPPSARAQRRVERAAATIDSLAPARPATALMQGVPEEVSAPVAEALSKAGYLVVTRHYAYLNHVATRSQPLAAIAELAAAVVAPRAAAPKKRRYTSHPHAPTYPSGTFVALGAKAHDVIAELRDGTARHFYAHRCVELIAAADAPPTRQVLTRACTQAYNARFKSNVDSKDVSRHISMFFEMGILRAVGAGGAHRQEVPVTIDAVPEPANA